MLKRLKKLFTRTICFQTENAHHRIVRIHGPSQDFSAVDICGFHAKEDPCLTKGDRITIQHKYRNGSPIIYAVLTDAKSDETGTAFVSITPAILPEDKGKKVTIYKKINIDAQ